MKEITRKNLSDTYTWKDEETGVEIKPVSIVEVHDKWMVDAEIWKGKNPIGDLSFQVFKDDAFEPHVVIFDRVMMESQTGAGVMTRYLAVTSQGYKEMGIKFARMQPIGEGALAFVKKNKFKKLDESYWELKI